MPEKAVAYTIGHAANSAPPAVMNQTWLPSQCGAMVLIAARRSLSFLPTNGIMAMEPISKPSVRAKPISNTPTSTHQIILRSSYSIMIEPLQIRLQEEQCCLAQLLLEHLVSRNGIYQYVKNLDLSERT